MANFLATKAEMEKGKGGVKDSGFVDLVFKASLEGVMKFEGAASFK